MPSNLINAAPPGWAPPGTVSQRFHGFSEDRPIDCLCRAGVKALPRPAPKP